MIVSAKWCYGILYLGLLFMATGIDSVVKIDGVDIKSGLYLLAGFMLGVFTKA